MPAFRIRRIFDDLLPIDRETIAQVQSLLRAKFPGIREDDVTHLAEKLRNPMKYRFRTFLYVSDDSRGRLKGFAVLSHEPDLRFWFLDYIATESGTGSQGIGGALYTRLREETAESDSCGLFFECAPDDPDGVLDKTVLKNNISRLRFYERFGARPLDNNGYRTQINPGPNELPFLVYDDLDRPRPLRRAEVQPIVRAILERKYAHWCTPAYVTTVVESFKDDPVLIRPPRYIRNPKDEIPIARSQQPCIALVVNDQHDIYHIRERGYVEAPVRIRAILREIDRSGLFEHIEPREYPDSHIRAVHDGALVDYLKVACGSVAPGKSVYPYVFPIRNQTRPPKELSVLAGYYCIDTFTPINRNAFPAAQRAVDCVLTAADEILRGRRLAYALVRPPGHHAEHRSFGGFCYFANAAVAAHYFSRHGRVALLDVDYHHGNGQENIFYERDDVLTISLHGDPAFAYPYFSGFADERGAGRGLGFNINYPLPEQLDAADYRKTLTEALNEIRKFAPSFLIVALGLDPAKGDPTGTWSFTANDFELNGRMIADLRLPTLVVQEGGYRTRTLGVNARSFFQGLAIGQGAADPKSQATHSNGKRDRREIKE